MKQHDLYVSSLSMDAQYMNSGLSNQWKDTSSGWKLDSIKDQIQVIFLDSFNLFKQRSLLIQSFNLCLPQGSHIVTLKELILILEKKEIV